MFLVILAGIQLCDHTPRPRRQKLSKEERVAQKKLRDMERAAEHKHISRKRKANSESLASTSQAKQQRLDYMRSHCHQSTGKSAAAPTIPNQPCADEFLSQSEKEACFTSFDASMSSLQHNECPKCKCVSLQLNMRKSGLCVSCSNQPGYDPVKDNMLPIWIDETGVVHYTIPDELNDLWEAEKLLLQMVAPYIPLVHIRNGTLGLKGHVCSFPQCIKDVCHELPRLPTDVRVVRMIRNFKEADGTLGMKSFRVHQEKVLSALRWLKKYNVEYRDNVTINEDNLNWMNGAQEAELPGIIDLEDNDTELDIPEVINFASDDERSECGSDDGSCVSGSKLEDLGPAAAQSLPDLETADEEDGLTHLGLHVIDSTPVTSTEDKETTQRIISACKQSGTDIPAVLWPYVSDEPVSEYDSSIKIFCRAFPWLYPGGIGDINDV